MLQSWLDRHRQTLLGKCAGLDAARLAYRSAPPSALSLLGLVRHLAEVERGWLRMVAAGEQLDHLYCSADDIADRVRFRPRSAVTRDRGRR